MTINMGTWWLSGRTSDSELRGSGFDPHLGHCVVSLGNTHLLPRVVYLEYPGSRLAGMLNLNTNKTKTTRTINL